MELKAIRYNIMAPCCEDYTATFVRDTSDRTMVRCKCGKIKTDFYDDERDAFQEYTKMLDDVKDDELSNISYAFCKFFALRKKLYSLDETLSDEAITQLLLTDELHRIAEDIEVGDFGNNVASIVDNLDAINKAMY